MIIAFHSSEHILFMNSPGYLESEGRSGNTERKIDWFNSRNEEAPEVNRVEEILR